MSGRRPVAEWSPAEIAAYVAQQVASQAGKPVQDQLSALEASLALLGVAFLRQQGVIEKQATLIARLMGRPDA